MATIASARTPTPDLVERIRRHADRDAIYIAILALVPWVLYVINRSWTYSIPDGLQLDPYFYTGYFQDLKGYNEAFGAVYYNSRVPWLLLGSFAYSLFEPETASLLLRVFLFYVSTFSLFVIVRQMYGSKFAAGSAAILMGTHTFFISSIAWDYVNGLGIAATFLTLAAFTLATKAHRWKPYLAVAGAGIVTAVSVHVFLFALVPFMVLHYLVMNYRTSRHPILPSVSLVAIGGAVAVVIYGLLNRLVSGELVYFVSSAYLAVAVDSYAALFAPWNRPFEEWITQGIASYLVMPLLALVSSVGLLVMMLRTYVQKRFIPDSLSFAGMAAINVIGIFCLFAVMQAASVLHLVQYWEYTSFIIPFGFIALGGVVASASERLDLKWRTSTVVLILLIMVSPYLTSYLRFLNECGNDCRLHASTTAAIVVVGALLLVAMYARSVPWLLAALCAFSILNVASAQLRFFEIPATDASRQLSRAVFDVNDAIREVDPLHRQQIWFDSKDENAKIFRAVAAMHLWEFRLLSTAFPSLHDEPTMGIRNLRVGENAIILSSRADAFKEGRESLKEAGLDAELVTSVELHGDKRDFELRVIKIVPGDLTPVARISNDAWIGITARVELEDGTAAIRAAALTPGYVLRSGTLTNPTKFKGLTRAAQLEVPTTSVAEADDSPGFVRVIGSVEGAPLAFELVLNPERPRIGQPLLGQGEDVDLYLWTDRLSDVKAVEVRTWNRERSSTARIETVEFLRVAH